MNFEWWVKMENETDTHQLEPSLEDKENMSFLRISVDKGRTYQCVAINSVGAGTMCSIEITGKFYKQQQKIWKFRLKCKVNKAHQ